MNELQQFQPQVMAVLGGLLQYLRGYRVFPEPGYHALAIALAAGGYVLFNPIDLSDWRVAVVRAIVGISGLVVSVWGGTFVASNAAKAGASFVPLTDSK